MAAWPAATQMPGIVRRITTVLETAGRRFCGMLGATGPPSLLTGIRRLCAMQKILPIFAVAAGIYAALGIWFPRLRAHWKGSRIVCGPVTCAGFALFFITLGTAFLTADAVSEPHRIWFVLPVILGWILAAFGYMLDARAYSRSRPSPPSQPQIGLSAEKRAWAFIAFGIFFLITILWTFVLHK